MTDLDVSIPSPRPGPQPQAPPQQSSSSSSSLTSTTTVSNRPSGDHYHPRTQPLTARQERKLVAYLDDHILDLTRNFKKRTHPSSTLPTLRHYLSTFRPLLALILQIPPFGPQATLRTALLLRLTGELLASIPGYPLAPDLLLDVLDVLDALDRGWAAVLRAQAWDGECGEGVDVEVELEDGNEVDRGRQPEAAPPVNPTERARLRSLLLAGTERLEEWLEGLRAGTPRSTNANGVNGANSIPDMNQDQDLESVLEQLGLEQAFDRLFERTLGEMGELGGEVLSAEGEVAMS